jgi:hypothetical protein
MAKIKAAKNANGSAETVNTQQDNPTDIAKIDVDDKTFRCPNEPNGVLCNSTFIQNTPGGKRCGACGYMFPRDAMKRPETTDFRFRK